MQEIGVGGLINMGNTCYANATLQAFRHCVKIPWIFEMGRYDTLFQKDPATVRDRQQALAKTFGEIMQLLQKCKKGQSVRPADFWAKFRIAVQNTGFEHLAMKEPHDSHEFYLFLLDTLHESMGQEVNMQILRPAPTTDAERHAIAALETWKREFSKKYSPLVDLFYGLQHIVTRCKACGNDSHRWEIFSALKAYVPPALTGAPTPPTLAEMIAEEFKPELISEYQCDKCMKEDTKKRSDAERTTSLWRLPLHVIVILKRFTPDGRKINTPMGALEGASFSFDQFFSAESPERVAETTFNLHSVVDHHGGMNGGHYTAQCLHPQEKKWILYDDEGSMPMPSGLSIGSSTYMLWFTRNQR
jgi:ubiquitin C-terminal hydrolase